MQLQRTQLDGETAEFWQQGDADRPPAHFYAANGFPLRAYRPLLSELSDHFALTALENRALWSQQPRRPSGPVRCRQYGRDLVRFLDANAAGPVIGIGHSMGATTTLMAAAARPDLFRALILIEPVLQSRSAEMLTRWLPKAWLRRAEPMKSTLTAPERWPDRDSAWRYYRAHRAYRRFDDAHLSVLVDGLLEPDGQGGVQLAFSRAWEVNNYLGLDCVWREMAQLPMPVRMIRGRPSLFLTEADWQKSRRLLARGDFHEAPEQGHLLPLENPAAVRTPILHPLVL